MNTPPGLQPAAPGLAPIESRLPGLQALAALLQQERSALQLGEHQRLSLLCRDKLPLLRDLNQLLAQLSAAPADAPLQTRQALQQLLSECLQLNRDNGVLLETLAARGRRRLQRLKGAPAQYDGRGRERFSLSGSVYGQA